MFENLLSHMGQLPLTESDLNQVISVDGTGKNATVGDLLDQFAPRAVLVAFGRVPASRPFIIKSVRDLDDREMREVVHAQLNTVPKDQALAVIGYDSFTVDQLRGEVVRQTPLGQRFVEIVKQHNSFLEEAIKRGKIFKKAETKIQIPDFDF